MACMQAWHQQAKVLIPTTPCATAMKRYDFFIPSMVV
jgi:hypothetical protein